MKQRTAVVTGAGSGMGRAIARALADRGDTVFAVARTAADLRETASGYAPDQVIPHPADVSDPGQVEALFDHIRALGGSVDVLVCSHGTYQGETNALTLPLEQFDRTLRVNLRACLHLAQLSARAMRLDDIAGRIVFISSVNGSASQVGAIDYDTSKAALNGLTRALAVDLGPYGITVNAIAPGWVRTRMSASELAVLHEEGKSLNPTRTVGEPEDIARAVLWLASPENSYTNGAVVPVDGGQLAMLPAPWRDSG
jgi:NAD(P)-dependent dehydrogenase (short-subunit alcohol dehydrogenase family)